MRWHWLQRGHGRPNQPFPSCRGCRPRTVRSWTTSQGSRESEKDLHKHSDNVPQINMRAQTNLYNVMTHASPDMETSPPSTGLHSLALSQRHPLKVKLAMVSFLSTAHINSIVHAGVQQGWCHDPSCCQVMINSLPICVRLTADSGADYHPSTDPANFHSQKVVNLSGVTVGLEGVRVRAMADLLSGAISRPDLEAPPHSPARHTGQRIREHRCRPPHGSMRTHRRESLHGGPSCAWHSRGCSCCHRGPLCR